MNTPIPLSSRAMAAGTTPSAYRRSITLVRRSPLVIAVPLLAFASLYLGGCDNRLGPYPSDFAGVIAHVHAGHLVVVTKDMKWRYHSFSPSSELRAYDISCRKKLIAYGCVDTPGREYSIEVCDRISGNTRRLEDAMPQSMRINPNGQRLAFFGTYNGRLGLHVWNLATDAVDDVRSLCKAYHTPQITFGDWPMPINWLGDDKLVVEAAGSDIVAISIVPPFTLTKLAEGQVPSLAPNGVNLVYRLDGVMWAYGLDTARRRELGRAPDGAASPPTWSLDSQYIVYIREMVDRQGRYALYAMRLETGTEYPLLVVDGWSRDLCVLPAECLVNFARE